MHVFWSLIKYIIGKVGQIKKALGLALMRSRLERVPLQTEGDAKFMKYKVHYTDWRVFYYEFTDMFMDRSYHFRSEKTSPLIFDCGSNIGMSIIYFKHICPKARVIGFEPDSVTFKILEENIRKNNLNDIRLVNAALSDISGALEFISDGMDGSHLAKLEHKTLSNSVKRCIVKSVKLSDYIVEPVDLLKVDVEGAEYEVLKECGDKLCLVKEMIIEYHCFRELKPMLPAFLKLLTDKGFRYIICSRNISPPLHKRTNEPNLLLIYAYRDAFPTE